jgi:polysaccharide export outer membrane protein
MHKTTFFITLLGFWLLGNGCISHKELLNFNEGAAFPTNPEDIAQFPSLRLQPDDILSVSIQSEDPEASAPFNFSGYPAANSADAGNGLQNPLKSNSNSGASTASYLIDANGEINFPVLGKIKVAGLSTIQLRDTLSLRITKYITKPIINVRLSNFRITLLGEVQRSGTFSFSNEKVSILEALGMAGDVTNYGNRENILVIREINGQRSYGHINLHQRKLFESPYYYLMQNDIIYVEPLRAKVGATTDETTKYLQWAFPIISLVSIIVSLAR